MGQDYELSAKFWGAGRAYKRVGALDYWKNMFFTSQNWAWVTRNKAYEKKIKKFLEDVF